MQMNGFFFQCDERNKFFLMEGMFASELLMANIGCSLRIDIVLLVHLCQHRQITQQIGLMLHQPNVPRSMLGW